MIERRIGHYSRRNLFYLIFNSLIFVLFLLGLIGFNVLITLSTNNLLLAFAIEIGKYLVIPINIFLAIMLVGVAIPFISSWRKFFKHMRPKNKVKYSIPEVEEKILIVLAERKGVPISRLALIRKVNFPGTMKEFTEILNQLWQEEIIKREFQDYPRYSAV